MKLTTSTNGTTEHTNGHAEGTASTSSSGPPKLAAGPLFNGASSVDRQQFVRLMIQALRDVGYSDSAAALEKESGFELESTHVSAFRHAVLNGVWEDAETELAHLNIADPDDLRSAQWLLNQQKYLELLEQSEAQLALIVLREALAPLRVDQEKVQFLSSLMMCSSADDLRERAGWDGAAGSSRRRLLQQLQMYIPPDVMLPPRRLPILLEQAQSHQRTQCLYHTQGNAISLLEDHACSRADFPVLTTQILAEHEHEVWYVQWSHDGRSLASASKDCSAIIWSIGPATGPAERDCRVHKVLKDHNDGVTALAWSMDDLVLLTSAGSSIKMWNTRTGACIRELTRHLRDSEISSLTYLHDGSGFVSAGMDRKIIVYDSDGGVRDEWPLAPVRISDLTISPDGVYLVAVGMLETAGPNASLQLGNGHGHGHGLVGAPGGRPGASSLRPQRKVVIYDFKSRTARDIIEVDGELTSVKVSKDSRYAIANHAPNEVQMWDLHTGRLARKFTGQKQGKHLIRSAFGGDDDSFVLSGSEDGNVYIWHRDTGVLLEVLAGHGEGSVNSVAWNPRESALFASCSDDHTIRLWEAPPLGIADFDRERERQRERMRARAAAADEEMDAGLRASILDLGAGV